MIIDQFYRDIVLRREFMWRRADQGREAKGENTAKRISTFCPYVFPGTP
jgi:hypothetical protein